ncbi:VWA-like domain-containing protein [Anaerocolumna sp. AGMB13025]|uniref:vWA domain-containing protein n=1 Tax=Anaerocolumna sp. AGMB13025 TaxID=3039116 RepID=UPI00241EF902|nr:VWA-like domain-containing protein [Anaerocolumna sp. AGMB13025]WFR55543.1 VWA-like domain-containing protein [Anaerocolumna sp. AGMB13025]
MAEDRELQLQKIGQTILSGARTELCLYMRYFNLPLSSLHYENRQGTKFLGTDGLGLYYDPEVLIEAFKAGPVFVNRMYLHVVLHCIFRHLFKPHRENKTIWDLACDIAVEYIIDGIKYRCVRYPASRYRLVFYENLKSKFKVPTAEKIFGLLLDLDMTQEEQEQLEYEFRKDDHTLWPQEDQKQNQGMESPEQKWKEISEKMQTDMETFSKEEAQETQTLKEEVRIENRKRYDYKSFLRKFAILKEEPVVDLDSYDTILYTYGLQLYGNMPLIEPQETKEMKKIEEIVIAVDTSLSCSGDLIREFLRQTYTILKESESYFRKINIHLIQCDDEVRLDQVITSQEELKEYMEHFEIVGNGGTDFRPVFDYVNQLIKQKVLKNLRGLIYFTDGQGEFPKAKPPYDTAFAFLRDNYEEVGVPPWAMKLLIESEALRQKTERDFNLFPLKEDSF